MSNASKTMEHERKEAASKERAKPEQANKPIFQHSKSANARNAQRVSDRTNWDAPNT